ncbi:type II toxin-antitoxin system death-on-curing family toxin [Asanoa iriomotensis]|uniref:Toxin Doc n=1 Tax=Asanoa iriomotensis TaxID=234613 RepID=A0ABQ4C3A9_9ACTN|nr:type II toxin-antitoxin system death-on-curing family toxin [Asanoa iriomotensis]GIF57271.1 toxin Doc [Asanoa iriomotensis]
MTLYLTVADVMAIADEIGAGGELRDPGLLSSAVVRPQTVVFGVETYTDVWDKAAALMHSLIANHPFVDGNKRTGLVSTLAFLDRNGIATEPLDEDLAYELTIGVAAGKIREVPEIAAGLRGCIG